MRSVIEMAPVEVNKSQMEKARECLIREIDEGLRHGFFDLRVVCEMINGKKRRLTIKAGKNHRFTIPAEDIE
jgi:hypothetical protein